MGYKSISLTGWQAGIYTDNLNQNAKIQNIDTSRIKKELNENKIVIIAGFQGIDDNLDITTLGRGGSDTTAVAIAAAVSAKECYIYSDVEGIYSADPKRVDTAKKLDNISYEEMLEISNEGAKVLHNRCVELARKYKVPIIAKSTFNNNDGTIIEQNMEETKVKSIVKNDDISRITIVGYGIVNNNSILKKVVDIIEEEHLKILNLDVNASKISIVFASKIQNDILNRFHKELII
ncbi:MAG: aspartate kinase [Clostridia bacterium]|nr:aspartate kinase [Clostridia bacterium]